LASRDAGNLTKPINKGDIQFELPSIGFIDKDVFYGTLLLPNMLIIKVNLAQLVPTDDVKCKNITGAQHNEFAKISRHFLLTYTNAPVQNGGAVTLDMRDVIVLDKNDTEQISVRNKLEELHYTALRTLGLL